MLLWYLSPMNKFDLQFHHLGLATRDEESARLFLDGMGYSFSDAMYDPLQKVNLRMCTSIDCPDVELITIADEDGPLNNIIGDHQGLIYHSCYSSSDVGKTLSKMKQHGIRVALISAPKPAKLFDGTLVSFYMVKGIGLLEIIHE